MAVALLSASFRCAREWGERALSLTFPWPESVEAKPVPIEEPYCRQCGEPFPALGSYGGNFLCYNCNEQSWHFQWGRAGYRAEGQVMEAIIGFKYRFEYYRLAQLSEWLTVTFDRHAAHEAWDALVPVPLYHRRHRDRGFNQSCEIARGLSKTRKIPVRNYLYRYRETISQAKLTRKDRLENMKNSFRVKPRFDVKGKNLLIIDDVFTTGATANACAHALAQSGAGRLAVLTIARS